jgi:hypothetical protein
MNPDDTTAHVARLLGCFPDVTVHSAVHSDKECKTYICLGIGSLQSLARLVHHCQCGANLGLHICTAGAKLEYGKPLDEDHFRYYITAPDDDGRSSFDNPPARLHILGIYLARDLKHLGLLAPDESDKLQMEWHGGAPM